MYLVYIDLNVWPQSVHLSALEYNDTEENETCVVYVLAFRDFMLMTQCGLL